MNQNNRFIINHHIMDDDVDTNELLILEPETNALTGTILFFHGHQVGMRVGAWEAPRYLLPLVKNNYRVIIPSILGYGKTTGNPDYCGPNTLHRIEHTVRNYIDNPVHVIGASRGGTLAILFAEHYPSLTRSCTAVAGAYDLETLVNTTPDEKMKENIMNEINGDAETYATRDPKTLWQKLNSPLHVVHGDKDEQIPVAQAESLVLFFREKGLQPKLTKLENSGHKLFSEKIFEETIIPFLKNT